MSGCTHKKYLLSPEFIEPHYEKKHVTFSTTLPLPQGPIMTSFFDCSKREAEVSAVFDCMKHLYPAPTGWSTDQKIMDYTSQKVLKNLLYSDLCVDKGRAVITYQRPDRQPDDYKSILDDICDGYIIVHAYKELSKNEEYADRAVPFDDMQKHYKSVCATGKNIGKNKPAFCFVEYKVEKEDIWYKKDCAEDILYNRRTANEKYAIITKYNYAWQFAEFAMLSYQDNIIGSFQNGWNHLRKHNNDKSGFYAHAFINNDLKMIGIVFRGTDDMSSDWVFSNSCFYFACTPSQYTDALEFYSTVYKECGKDFQYIVSGHSLGGGLAQLISIEKEIEAIVFDSPGALNPARQLFPDSKIYSVQNKITSYISGVNLVNSCCPHIVDSVQIQDQIIEDCDKLFATDYTSSQHNMTMIFQKFDKDTGKPFNSVIVKKGDLTLLNSYERFGSQCGIEKHDCQLQMYNAAQYSKPHKNKLTIDDTKLMVSIYLIAPKNSAKSSVCPNFSKISEEGYTSFLEYAQNRVIDQVKYEIPCFLNLQNIWKVDNSYNQFVDVYSIEMSCDLGEDRDFYRKKIIESDFYHKYDVSHVINTGIDHDTSEL